ncbi:MAG: hypothetical protein GWN02_18830, partial [Gemmatimonadetes bacterium]|nr:hypothetical protein [Gemmatimonadota bacterium]NIW62384.1 hypothetical protein [Gemmatimonadota bacterium]NIY10202.1 hypothetical protein [Gemmatimonadota bacterium]
MRIPSAGGTPEVLFEGEGSSVLAFTDVLPGGRKALARTGTFGGSEIVTVDLDSGRVDPLTPGLF